MKSFIAVFLSLALLSSAEAKEKPQIVTLSVTENGFEPNSVDVNPGVPVILKITRKTDSTCATKIQIPSKKIKRDLPLNKEVKIEVGKLEKGEIRFGCGMGMMAGGKIFVR
jgi:plastocyanin domain-containing protein